MGSAGTNTVWAWLEHLRQARSIHQSTWLWNGLRPAKVSGGGASPPDGWREFDIAPALSVRAITGRVSPMGRLLLEALLIEALNLANGLQ